MNEELLNRKAIKQIKIILILGLILLLTDYGLSLFSNSLSLISNNGDLYMERPLKDENPGHVILRAEVNGNHTSYSKSFDLTITPYKSKSDNNKADTADESDAMTEEELIAYEVRSVINSLNEDSSRRRVTLPSRLSSGEKINWTIERKNNTPLIAFAVIALAAFVSRNRLSPLKKQQQAEQDSITRQLPEFVNRLVLLLNAGLVLNSAFEKTIEESRSLSSTSGDFFYTRMREIYDKVKETNSSMGTEFREFARSRSSISGDTAKELMRISNIISDNISKGVELTDKLQRESETLWLNRKRNCEERGRLAETKLTLPLTVFLVVLIVITVSPALLEL